DSTNDNASDITMSKVVNVPLRSWKSKFISVLVSERVGQRTGIGSVVRRSAGTRVSNPSGNTSSGAPKRDRGASPNASTDWQYFDTRITDMSSRAVRSVAQ